ncbi:hypothetical protein QQF64_035852 [Cirrhinus molitorella]|uniref:Uncharacterized protein n=1 Tax=Cirrhinus molitorella TaxID=172907 RepID=A0ABR3NH40_9TELE
MDNSVQLQKEDPMLATVHFLRHHWTVQRYNTFCYLDALNPTPLLEELRKSTEESSNSEDNMIQRAPASSANRGGDADQSWKSSKAKLLPLLVLREISLEVVLQDGDVAIGSLALTCRCFNSIVCVESFRREAHFWCLDIDIMFKTMMSSADHQSAEEREGRKEMEELDQLDCLIKELQDIDSQVDHQDVTILSTSQTLCVENIKHTTWRSRILCCFISSTPKR